LLWEAYRQSVPLGYSYTQFCVLFRERAQCKNLTLTFNHKPGALLQFDYGGATVPWIGRGENVLITGATGCGKSHLACALGHHACSDGRRTLYFNLNLFCEQIALAQAVRRCG